MLCGGASPSRTKIASPLNRLRLKAGLSIPHLAERFGVTTATVSRWCSGARQAPPEFVLALHTAAVETPRAVAEAQKAYRARRHRQVKVTVELVLPEGVTEDEARECCAAAMAEAAVAARR